MEQDKNLTVERTYEDWFSFAGVAQRWLNKTKGNELTKLGYALSRIIPRVQKALEKEQRKHQNKIEKIRIQYCFADEKGKVMKTPTGEYEFERGQLSKFRDEEEVLVEALLETKIKIAPYFSTHLPAFLFHYPLAFKFQMEPLTGVEQESFFGIVIREEDAEASLDAAFPDESTKEAEAVQ